MRMTLLVIELYAPWVHSLKEKRSEVKSLLAKIQNRFNVAAVEAEAQDVHQTIVLGIGIVAADSAQLDRVAQRLLGFVEANTPAEIVGVRRE